MKEQSIQYVGTRYMNYMLEPNTAGICYRG